MFNFRHPRPVVDGRAVAVQVVQQKQASKPQTGVLVIDKKEEPAPVPPTAGTDASTKT
ncbi:hypothetical protein LK540_24735 [Massilia sp. IC2-278]|uniref:hypothetical protein n=1 Tax=Massilia sp. IC2-278 TaxID=2887200 RepID=UPI001E515244|nr:hypothetical protein [Massilia sp. IC2-278]MCC2963649.1 hypothetical protein [Massilia sp. IC2-278]